MTRLNVLAAVVAGMVMMIAMPAGAVVLGQLDDFEDGTLQGWGVGTSNPNPPVNAPDGGPIGAGDAYMLVTADISGAGGSRLVTNNSLQWAGDYLAAGVMAIAADMNNLSDVPVTMRLALDGAGGRFSSTLGVTLAANSGWVRVVLPIGPADLTAIGGGAHSVLGTLGDLTLLRIMHAAAPGFSGDEVTGMVGMDNIKAIPEPTTCMLVALAGLAAGRRRRSALSR